MDAKFFDSLYEGDSPNGVKLGMCLTGGDFWPLSAGCQSLYRGTSMDTVDFANILGVSDITKDEISPPNWLEHNPSTTYFYVLRRCNCCGNEERSLGAAVKIAIDSNGDLSKCRCNSIFSVKAIQVEGDKIKLVWFYWPIEQEAEPDSFKVYWDNGTGQIDYENPVAVIDYFGRAFYTWQSAALTGEAYLFCIRVVTSTGADDEFTGQITIQLRTTKPDSIEILEAVVV